MKAIDRPDVREALCGLVRFEPTGGDPPLVVSSLGILVSYAAVADVVARVIDIARSRTQNGGDHV